jgi:hypothetical protein
MTPAQLDHVASDQGSDVIWPPNPYVHGLGGGGGFFGPALPPGPAALLRAIKEEVRTINSPPAPSHAINSPPTPAEVFSLITGRLLIDATSPTLRSALFSVVAHHRDSPPADLIAPLRRALELRFLGAGLSKQGGDGFARRPGVRYLARGGAGSAGGWRCQRASGRLGTQAGLGARPQMLSRRT